jgi:hypothetical protein
MKISSSPSRTAIMMTLAEASLRRSNVLNWATSRARDPTTSTGRNGPVHRVLEEWQNAVGETLTVFFVFV